MAGSANWVKVLLLFVSSNFGNLNLVFKKKGERKGISVKQNFNSVKIMCVHDSREISCHAANISMWLASQHAMNVGAWQRLK